MDLLDGLGVGRSAMIPSGRAGISSDWIFDLRPLTLAAMVSCDPEGTVGFCVSPDTLAKC